MMVKKYYEPVLQQVQHFFLFLGDEELLPNVASHCEPIQPTLTSSAVLNIKEQAVSLMHPCT